VERAVVDLAQGIGALKNSEVAEKFAKLSTPLIADDALQIARFGDFEVTSDDCVFADDDGCVFVVADKIDNVLAAARAIWNTERKQADKIRAGTTLRQQLKFVEFLKKRSTNPAYTFREHLRDIGGAIEE
jgi:4-hydroxy-4-methyl-2-oxoglutarate aldolase